MRPDNLSFAPVILPLFGAALAFCAKAFGKKSRVNVLEYISVFIGLALPWVAFIYLSPSMLAGNTLQGVVGNWHSGIGIHYRFDGLAWLVNMLGFSVGAAAWIYSLGAGPKGPAFSAVFLIQTAALAATIMTADLFNLFVCLEVMGIASYVLIASSDKPGASLASFSYLMISATAMVFFLIGIFGLYRLTGELSYEGIAAGLQGLTGAGEFTAIVSLALITAAVAIRVAVLPLYGWLPDAHALAPHAVSAVLSGVLIKTPLFALSRVLLLMPVGARAGELMGYAGAVTALAGVIIALAQKDAKRLLAYHSISQIGYVVSAWGTAVYVGTEEGIGLLLMAAAFMHAFFHALFKGLLFLSVGTTIDKAKERDVYTLRGGAGILFSSGEKVPITLLCFIIGALSISAIPPFNGFASKTALTYGLNGTWQYYLLFAAGIGTLASFIKLSRIFWPKKRTQLSPENTAATKLSSVHPAILIAELLLGGLCVVTGLKAPAIYKFITQMLANRGSITPPSLDLYSTSNLFKTLILVAGGTLLFLAVSSKIGSKLLKVIRERPRSFQGLFVSFALGAAGLAGWLLFFR